MLIRPTLLATRTVAFEERGVFLTTFVGLAALMLVEGSSDLVVAATSLLGAMFAMALHRIARFSS